MSEIPFEKVAKHLESKWGQDRTCPMCGHTSWFVQDHLFELREFNQGSVVLGGPIMPLAAAICANCGNTVLVNALTAELTVPPAEAAKPLAPTKEEAKK